MSGSWFSKSIVCASALVGLMLVASCGKAPQPIPQIAPPPTTNNNPYGGFSGGSCGATGTPIAPINSSGSMFTNQLSSQNGSGTIAMNVYMADQYYSSNVNVSANFVIQSQQGTFQFCASTSGQFGNQPGQIFAGQQGQYGPTGIRATLTGPVNMPIYSPWNGQVTYSQGFATVKIGIACPASYIAGKIMGCVEITIQGASNQYFPMTANQ